MLVMLSLAFTVRAKHLAQKVQRTADGSQLELGSLNGICGSLPTRTHPAPQRIGLAVQNKDEAIRRNMTSPFPLREGPTVGLGYQHTTAFTEGTTATREAVTSCRHRSTV